LSPSDRSDPAAADAGTVVLERTPRGEAELARPMLPLSVAQRLLLQSIDAAGSLRELAERTPTLASASLTRDAARLLAFGLVRQLRGELPREAVVSAMNLTMRVPAQAFSPLAAQAGQAAPSASADPPRRSMRRVRATAIALALVAAAAAAAWWLR
jgi:hypothetical protein